MSDKKLKVLLVEDDQMIVEMYKLKLETEGFEVFVTDKGSEAIELALKIRVIHLRKCFFKKILNPNESMPLL
jgi:CheY-like chemotaxis protein